MPRPVSSDLIIEMLKLKRYSMLFLSAQLFFVSALCGGACCDPAFTRETSEKTASAAVEENRVSHAHCHANKTAVQATSKAAAKQTVLQSARHASKSAKLIDRNDCACGFARHEPVIVYADLPSGRDPKGAAETASPMLPSWSLKWGSGVSPPSATPSANFSIHAISHTGSQLNLRI